MTWPAFSQPCLVSFPCGSRSHLRGDTDGDSRTFHPTLLHCAQPHSGTQDYKGDTKLVFGVHVGCRPSSLMAECVRRMQVWQFRHTPALYGLQPEASKV